MNWSERLVEASYQGKTFLTEDFSVSGGWRIALHEYPFKDDPFPENMGKKAHEFSFNAYFIGKNYDLQVADFHKLLETEGEGTLVHPRFGTATVQLLSWQYKETTREGGIGRYALKFVRSGQQRFPSVYQNPLASIQTTHSQVWDALDQVVQKQCKALIQQAGGEIDLLNQLKEVLSRL